MGNVWRWIEEPEPIDPVENMARDAALLDEMIRVDDASAVPAIRVYRWSKPAVTIGRLQNEDELRAAFPGWKLVRRPTGGRAVVHGEDVTVSVATRDEWLPRGTGGTVLSSYQVIVAGVIEALCRNGIDAELGDSRETRRAAGLLRPVRESNHVDCFAAVASCDIADPRTGYKLVGSAQRRDRGAILQQMSIRGDIIRRISSIPDFVSDLRSSMKAALQIDEWIICK